MGQFTEGVEPDGYGKRGFTYTDEDGDVLKVWRWNSSQRHLRFEAPKAQNGVDVDGYDFEEFFKRVAELRKSPCINCGGSGWK